MNNTLLKKSLSGHLLSENTDVRTTLLSDSVTQSAYSTGEKIGILLAKVHSHNPQNSNINIPLDGGTKNPLPFGMHGFHDRCHKSIFYDAVARRIGAVQTTYVWQYVIQYLYKLENLPEPCLIVGDIDTTNIIISDSAHINISNASGRLGDSLIDFGAIFRTGLNENNDFVAGLESGYTLDLPENWIEMAKMLDLGWWLNQISNQQYGSPTIQPIVDGMLKACKALGAGNSKKFSYAVDTTALVLAKNKK